MEVGTNRRLKGRQPKARRKSLTSNDSASEDFTLCSSGPVRKKKRTAGISGTRRDGVMIVKGNWTDAEDQHLSNLVSSHNMTADSKTGSNTRWSEIAKNLPGRVGKQCRERWHNHLRPDINKGRWSFSEEIVIYVCWRRWSSQWARISRLLEGRSDNRVKNHWNCHMKRRLMRDAQYAEFLENSTACLGHFLQDGYEDDSEVTQLRQELMPHVENYLNENRNLLERLPYFASQKREVKNGRDPSSPVVYQQVKLMLENPGRPSKPPKPAKTKKQRKVRKRNIPPSFVQDSWVEQQSIETDAENSHRYYTGDHFGRLGGLLYHRYEGINQDTEMDVPEVNGAENPLDTGIFFYTNQDSQSFNSQAIYCATEIVLGEDEPLLNGDPMWTKAVSVDYGVSSPSTSRRNITSTPRKSASYVVPSSSECGTSFVTPTHSRKPTYDFMISPIRKPYFEESSIWSPSKGFGIKIEEWSPAKYGNSCGIKTPQPIREALASSEANRSNISPEDLASPSRLFSDASELIDGELNQSCSEMRSTSSLMESQRTPELSKCRRRLVDQWSSGVGASSFNSSGYMSYGTPSTD